MKRSVRPGARPRFRSAMPWLVLLLAAAPAAVRAQPLARDRVPEPLVPWIDWVLHGHEEALCPFLVGPDERRQCVWPARLDLDVADRGCRFTQEWLVHRDGWVPLPGDPRSWPRDVRVGGRPAVVTPRGDIAGVRLAAGRNTVSGVFEWETLPPVLQVPRETGIVALRLRGRAVPLPQRDGEGRLWLQRGTEETAGESRLDLDVHRVVTDDIPLVLTTRVEMRVSGRSREVLLGRVLPDRFIPMALRSPLPARLDPDGRLRAQVRPGAWRLELQARHPGPVAELALGDPDGPWDAEEIWVFEARPHLRTVAIEGAPEIDPQQTTLPDDLKRLPAYRLRPGMTLRLVEKQRGDADPPPDALALARTLWLDFDGGGWTFRDRITGALRRSWRLDLPPPADLGRVSIDGRDQFITRLRPDGPAGVEIRQGRVDLEADGRLEGNTRALAAVGWDADFGRVSARLLLPPGWWLLHATGVDDVSATWISSWSLLDFFLVLILALSIGRLAGRRWGVLALVTLGLTWIEPGAPRWTWVLLLPGVAIVRLLPAGRMRRALQVYVGLAFLALVLALVPFMILQVRGALYPALEERGPYRPVLRARAAPEMPPPGMPPGALAPEAGQRLRAPRDLADEADLAQAPERREAPPEEAERLARSKLAAVSPVLPPPAKTLADLAAPDPNAIVQTGPGVPEWNWRAVTLSWRGPVEKGQRLRLVLAPPRLNAVLAVARVALLAVLGLGVLGLAGVALAGRLPGLPGARGGAAVLAALLGLGWWSGPARADIPPDAMLETLRARLLAPPDCRPDCAAIPRLILEATPDRLAIRLEAHAAAGVALPLPAGADQWLPERVILDGAPAPGLARSAEGRLLLALAPGTHQVLLDGPLPERDEVRIPLPLRPRRVEVRALGWRVEGLLEDGQAADGLQLIRTRPPARGAGSGPAGRAMTPFVRVERSLDLGLRWSARTRVVRLTPAGEPVVLEVPLLPGESVTTPEVRVAAGRVQATLGAQAQAFGWESALAEGDAVRLAAPDTTSWSEVWLVAASAVWHLEADGIPVVHRSADGPLRLREWRPWPGETVTLRVTRPEGHPGRTLTIDRSLLAVDPGLRATDAVLDLSFRSSRGGQHAIRLPEGAELQSVRLNGEQQPVRQDGRGVTLPVAPGATRVQVAWRQRDGMRALLRAPEVDLAAPSVNAAVRIAMPADRWTLFLRGPRLGPAVLFWSVLAVSLLAALGLGQVRLTPLRWQHWFLLSLGLTQVPVAVAVLIALWLVALGWRQERAAALGKAAHNTLQVALVLLTGAALAGLFWSIQKGLLGLPEMQISGNDSSARLLQWYQDRAGAGLPRPRVLSVPLWVYRLAMLAWALWLAQALLGWLRWGWRCFSTGGAWRPIRRAAPPPIPAGPAG